MTPRMIAAAALLPIALLAQSPDMGFDDDLGALGDDTALSLDAEPPKATQLFLEAENFEMSPGWTAVAIPEAERVGEVGRPWPWHIEKDKSRRLASGLRFALGSNGTARATFTLPHEAAWKLWLCFSPKSRQFKASLRRADDAPGGETLATLASPAGGLADSELWRWESLAFTAGGRVVLEVEALDPARPVSLDCAIATDDGKYLPDVRDFNHAYVRFTTDAGFPKKAEALLGYELGGANLVGSPSPGKTSEWFDISRFLRHGITERVVFRCEAKGRRVDEGWTAELSFDGTNAVAALSPPDWSLLVNLAQRGAKGDAELAAADLALARATGPGHARRPRRYRVGSTLALHPGKCSPEALAAEAEVFAILGLNDFGSLDTQRALLPDIDATPDFLDANDFTIWSCHKGCPCSPDLPAITNAMRRAAKRHSRELEGGRRIAIGLMDEPGMALAALTNCASRTTRCPERFRSFLAARGLSPSDFGRASWEDVNLTADPADGLLYRWSLLYRNHVTTAFFGTCNDIAASVHSNLSATANIATELVFNGSLTLRGANFFDLCSEGGVRCILTEDWANLQHTYQHCSYQCDVIRAAARRTGATLSMLNVITGRSGREIAAKAFSEAGRGVKAMFFFRYGPDYTGASDPANKNPAIYLPIRTFCDATAEVEDRLVDGQVAKGDAALLLSVTGETWSIPEGTYPAGKDRMALSLALNHSGIRTDILSEDDLLDALDGYKVLFATDIHVRRACAEAIAAWLRKGGTLVLSGDALSRDERDAPIDAALLEGAGTVLRFPAGLWKRYVAAAEKLGGYHSNLRYDEGVRAEIAALAAKAGVKPLVKSDNPLVEVSLIESPHGGLLVVSNWSSEPRKVTITFADGRPPIVRDVDFGCYIPLE